MAIVAVDERAVDVDEHSAAGHALSLPDASSVQSNADGFARTGKSRAIDPLVRVNRMCT